MMIGLRLGAALVALALYGAPAGATPSQEAPADGTAGLGPVTNLPLPRYVSLETDEGNARRGPSRTQRIDWVFRHRDMPLRITAEFENWRRVEDRDGAGGWIHYSMLSGVRTVLIEPDMVDLLAQPRADASVVARAEGGAIARLGECEPDWCRISADGQRGWVPKAALWGVDPGEIRD